MDNISLLQAAEGLVKSLDKMVDESLPKEIANIIKTHSKGAAVAAVASGWVPGVGGAAAVTISAGFIWTMYGKINSKIDLPFSENIMKSLASGVATNIAAYAVTAIALSTAFSLLPGIGSIPAAGIAGVTCYGTTLGSGYVYLKILTKVFQSGKDPSTLTAEDLKNTAKTVMDNEDMKKFMKEAKEEYKSAKASGELDE